MMTSNNVFYLPGVMQSHVRAALSYGNTGERACVCVCVGGGGEGGELGVGSRFSEKSCFDRLYVLLTWPLETQNIYCYMNK